MKKKISKYTLITLILVELVVILFLFKGFDLSSRIKTKIYTSQGKIELNYEYNRKRSIYSNLDSDDSNINNIVFAGDSLIAGNNWDEMLPEKTTRNRGISGDTVIGLKNRIAEIAKTNPKATIIQIGINDLISGKDIKDVNSEYKDLVDSYLDNQENANLILMMTFPINEDIYSRYYPSSGLNNNKIQSFKTLMKSTFENYDNVRMLDISKKLVDKNGNLKENYTVDGLHLTAGGYKVWIEELDKLL